MTMFITFGCMFFLSALSEPLIYCMIGAKWYIASTYLPLICIVGSLYPLHAINLNMLQVQGRSDLFLGLEIIKKIINLGPLFVGVFVGVMPMLWTACLTGVIAYFLNSYYSGKFIGYSSWMQIRDVTPSACISAVTAMFVYLIKFLPFSFWIILPLQIILGVVLFFGLCKVSRLQEYAEIKEMLSPILSKFKIN